MRLRVPIFVSLLATPAVFILACLPRIASYQTTTSPKKKQHIEEGKGVSNVNLHVDFSMDVGGVKKSLHNAFASIPQEKLLQAFMSVLTDGEVELIKNNVQSGVNFLVDNDSELEDEDSTPESSDIPIIADNDFQDQEKSTKTVDDTVQSSMRKRKRVLAEDFVVKNDESLPKPTSNRIIDENVRSEFPKLRHNKAISSVKEKGVTTKTIRRKDLERKRRSSTHSSRNPTINDNNNVVKEKMNEYRDVSIASSKITSNRLMVECSRYEVPGKIQVTSSSEPQDLIWEIYETKSDLPLIAGYGQESEKEICFKMSSCYVFRAHGNGVENYKVFMDEFLAKEGDTVASGHSAKFGWKSCCNTSCCRSTEAQAMIVIEAHESTEALNWNLVAEGGTDELQKVVIGGGGYQETMETNTFITHTCIDPMICHTLQVFADNETISSDSLTSYHYMEVHVNGEIKVRDWNVSPGENRKFCSICSTKPLLLPILVEGDATANQRARDIMNTLSFVSSSETFVNTASAQYKAMCWIIFDDLRQVEADSVSIIQRYVLAVLYYETHGDNWVFVDFGDEPSYLTQDDECAWQWSTKYIGFWGDEGTEPTGIVCRNGLVWQLILSKTNLKGSIPSEITNLRSLQSISLLENELVGPLPEEIGNLKDLRVFYIQENNLSGSLPEGFFNMQLLMDVNFGQNQLTGTISSLIGQLQYLESLDLHKNLFDGELPEELYGLTSLRSIMIASNMFTGTISSSIGKLSGLFEIAADYNMFEGSIPSTIGQTALVFVVLGDNELTGTIPKEFMQLSLETLVLKNNKLEGPIPREIEETTSLVLLDVKENILSGEIPIFPPNITSIDIKNNQLYGTIPADLSNLQLLQSLQMDNNKLEGTVPNEICELRSNFLATLSTDCDGYFVPPEVNCECCTYCTSDYSGREKIGECPDGELVVKMKYSNLNWYSKFWSYKDGTKQIVDGDQYGLAFVTPEESTYTSCFASTDCYEFTVGGDDYTYYMYPDSYMGFTISYKDNIIYDNDDEDNRVWKGKIQFGYSNTSNTPKVNECDNILFQNEELVAGTFEHVAYNQIIRMSGPSISPAMAEAINWIRGDTLDLGASNVYRLRQRYILALLFYSTSGANWTKIENFASSDHECDWMGITCDAEYGLIESISLRDNNLIGTLPFELGELLKLKLLDLSLNSGLVSTLPDQVANLWSLETLHLSLCGIHGSIPSAFGLLSNLVSLDLGGNQLNMSIPEETKNLKRLEELVLNDNALTGTLPNYVKLGNLKVIDVSNNNIGGGISNEVIFFEPLVTLNVANNLFKGTVPFDLTKSANLSQLILSDNQFEGIIPFGFGNLEGLTVFALDGNQLKGNIPEDLLEVVGLKQVRLHNNGLVGTIPASIKTTELEELSLSYNGLKGPIPEQIEGLRKLNFLHIHMNDLTGSQALMTDCEKWGPASERSFIADCGVPYTVRLGCECCTICCNADTYCQANPVGAKDPIVLSIYAIAASLGALFLLPFFLKYIWTCIRKRLPDYNYELAEAFGDDSIYVFFIADDWKCWFAVFFTAACQVGLFCIFLRASQLQYDSSDWEYSQRCFATNEPCLDTKGLTWLGWTFFVVMLVYFLGCDTLKAWKVLYIACKTASLRVLMGGLTILAMLQFAFIASVYYNYAIAYTDSEIILNAVVLAIVTDMDEKALEICNTISEPWVEEKLEEVNNYAARLEASIGHHRHPHGRAAEELPDVNSNANGSATNEDVWEVNKVPKDVPKNVDHGIEIAFPPEYPPTRL